VSPKRCLGGKEPGGGKASYHLEIRRKATVTATKTREGRRGGGDPVAAAWDSASGRRGGGYLEGIRRWQLGGAGEEEILRRSRGGGGPEGSSRRLGPASGSAYQEAAASWGGWVLHYCS
jgi:hypothetical protein